MRLLMIFAGLLLYLAGGISGVGAQGVDTLWTRYYWNGSYDEARSVAESRDSGFIVAGMSVLQGDTHQKIHLFKTDFKGDLQWSKLYGTDTTNEQAHHVLSTHDGGFLVSAERSYSVTPEVWIIKTDEHGDTVWTFTPSGLGNGHPLYAIQLPDSSYAITGAINWGYQWDAFILRLDKDGGFIRQGRYGGTGTQEGHFIGPTPDSGFILAVFGTSYTGTQFDFRAIRTDSIGSLIWDSTYVLSASNDMLAGACLADDGMVMTGLANDWIGHALKVDFDGHTVWSKTLGGPLGQQANSICCTPDGGFMVGGWREVVGQRRDFSFTKIDEHGDTAWTYLVGGGDDDQGQQVVRTCDDCYILLGHNASIENGTVAWLVKLGEAVLDVEEHYDPSLPKHFELGMNYPNPFNPTTLIAFSLPFRTEVRLAVYNLLGQEVKVLARGSRAAGTYTVLWDGTNEAGMRVPSGVYFYRLEAGPYVASRKMVLVK